MKQGVNFVAMRPLPFYVTRLQRPRVLWPLPFRELLSPSLSGQGWLVWIGKKGDEALVYRTGQKATSRQRGHIYKSKLFIHLSQLTYVPCGKIKPSGSQREGDQDLWIPKHSTLLGSPSFSLVNLRSSSQQCCPVDQIFQRNVPLENIQPAQTGSLPLYIILFRIVHLHVPEKNTKVGLKLMKREEVYVLIRNRNILVWGYSSVDKMLAAQA